MKWQKLCEDTLSKGYTVNFFGVNASITGSPKFSGWICQIYDYPDFDWILADVKAKTMRDAFMLAYEDAFGVTKDL